MGLKLGAPVALIGKRPAVAGNRKVTEASGGIAFPTPRGRYERALIAPLRVRGGDGWLVFARRQMSTLSMPEVTADWNSFDGGKSSYTGTQVIDARDFAGLGRLPNSF